MNPKVIKLKEEYQKNAKKIDTLQTRNKKIEVLITDLENADIIGMVREYGLSTDQLMELLRKMKNDPLSDVNPEGMEETDFEE